MSVSDSFLDGVELLKENVVATKLIDKGEEHCECYGMDEMFKIVVPPADGTNNIDDTQTKDLFANYSNLTRAKIISSIRFYMCLFGIDPHSLKHQILDCWPFHSF